LTEPGNKKPFAWPVRVYYEDTDAQGLVYFANYFKFMERARTEWLRALGLEQDVFMRKEHRYFVVLDTQAEFLSPARFNDELLVTANVREASRATFTIEQAIYRNTTAGEVLCRGTTRAACINADTLKPARLPEFLLEENRK
jgi:acyl-CoA thioester hydrolase